MSVITGDDDDDDVAQQANVTIECAKVREDGEKRMAKVYIAGPMTGYPELNYPKFAEVAVRLRAMGFEVVSPAELNPMAETYFNAMKKDILALVDCDHICLLEGWEQSKGASLEHHIATVLGLTVIQLDNPRAEVG